MTCFLFSYWISWFCSIFLLCHLESNVRSTTLKHTPAPLCRTDCLFLFFFLFSGVSSKDFALFFLKYILVSFPFSLSLIVVFFFLFFKFFDVCTKLAQQLPESTKHSTSPHWSFSPWVIKNTNGYWPFFFFLTFMWALSLAASVCICVFNAAVTPAMCACARTSSSVCVLRAKKSRRHAQG